MTTKKCTNHLGEVVSENWGNFTELATDIARDNNFSLDFFREDDVMKVKATSINSTHSLKKGAVKEWVFCSAEQDEEKATEEISVAIVDSYTTDNYFIES